MTDVKVHSGFDLPMTLLRKMGVDRAIAYTVASRAWSSLSGPLTMFFVIRFLTPEQQGYFYTFGNMLALTVIFELGLVMVISQFASHEMAKLHFTPEGLLAGDDRAKGRMATLMRTSC